MSEEWLRKLPNLKSNLLEAKTLALSRILENYIREIKNINNLIQQSTIQFQTESKLISQKYDKTLEEIEVLLNSKRLPSRWTPEEVENLIHLESKTITRLSFLIEGKLEKYLYHIRNKELYIINTEGEKKINIPSLPETISPWSTVVDCDENTIFLLGCRNWSDCYKISKKEGECFNVPDIPGGRMSFQGSVKLGNSIYLFGGFKQPGEVVSECYKLDVKTEIWSRISDLPVASCYNSAVKVGKEILVTGLYLEGIYKYNLEEDIFSLLFWDNTGIHHRTIFKTSRGDVVMAGEKFYKSKKTGLERWTEVRENPANVWILTDRLEYKGKMFYLDKEGDLNILDIDTYELKQKSIDFN